jgi:DNA-binding protein Fis
VLGDEGIVDADDLPLGRRRGAKVGSELGDPELTLATIERMHVERVLAACGGNQSEAARRLGIGRNTLARKLEGE